MVMVVPDSKLVKCRRARRLDAPDKPRLQQRRQDVVDRLGRHRSELGAHEADDGVGVGVRLLLQCLQHAEARRRDSQACRT
jgi:hypothetical protein